MALSKGAIAGIAIGPVLISAILAFTILCILRKRRVPQNVETVPFGHAARPQAIGLESPIMHQPSTIHEMEGGLPFPENFGSMQIKGFAGPAGGVSLGPVRDREGV